MLGLISLASVKLDFDRLVGMGALLLSALSLWTARRSNQTAKGAAEDAKRASSEARSPALTVDDRPVTELAGSTIIVKFNARNAGKGTARILSFAVTDAGDPPTLEKRRIVLAEGTDVNVDGDLISPDEQSGFELTVEEPWFLGIVGACDEWALEIVYTDRPPTERFRTRLRVTADPSGAGWTPQLPITTRPKVGR